MGGNTYYHSDMCSLPDLEMEFKGKPHLGMLLKDRRWVRFRARIKKENRKVGKTK